MSLETPFKNAVNVWRTKSLFFEQSDSDKTFVLYTLKDKDHEGFPSLYRLYMETADLTEYEFAVKHLGGWDHWTTLCNLTWFKPIVNKWREELFLRAQSAALRKVQESAAKGNLVANRYLLERGWEPKKSTGRPSKEAIKSEAKRQQDEFMEDYNRIMTSEKRLDA